MTIFTAFSHTWPNTTSSTASGLVVRALAPLVFGLLTPFAVMAAPHPNLDPGIPVYLKPDSRYPSGVHKRDWLESRTKDSGDSQMQRWFRVETGGQYGWVAEDHVLTALKLSSIARTVRDEPDRSAPQLDALRKRRIPKNSQVIILETQGSWSRGRVLGDSASHQDSWLLNEALKRDSGNQIERGMVFRPTSLRASPQKSARTIAKMEEGEEISVIRTQFSDGLTWIEVQLETTSAWLDRRDVWLSLDLADGSARSRVPGLELRSSPYPNADVVKRLSMAERLKVLTTKYLRWGHVRIPEHGYLWWPISDDIVDQPGFLPPMKISTGDLLSRGLYDMVAGDRDTGLRFASARGVFRSRDGREWSKIPKFEDKNYPLATTSNGWIFVGPYLSRDQGANFDQWIRWDILVETVKRSTGSMLSRVRISNIIARANSGDGDRPGAGDEIQIELDMGRSQPLQLITEDLGRTWQVLSKTP